MGSPGLARFQLCGHGLFQRVHDVHDGRGRSGARLALGGLLGGLESLFLFRNDLQQTFLDGVAYHVRGPPGGLLLDQLLD